MISRLLHHSTVRAFEAWASRCAGDKRRRVAVMRTIIRCLHRTTAQAWDRWAGELVKSQRRRHLVAKAVGRWTNAAVSHAFQMWADAVEGERAEQKTRRAEQLESDNSGMASKLLEVCEEHKALLLRSQHMTERGAAHRQRLLLMISSRLLHRSTGRAFWAWLGNARVVREGRRKVGFVMRRWRQRDVASACKSWYEHVASVRKMRSILGILRARCSRIICRLLHHSTARVFE